MDFETHQLEYPDLDLENRNPDSIFYNPVPTQTFAQLPHLKPSCLYVYGSRTHMVSSQSQGRADKLELTGTGFGGSGGHADGKVDELVLNGSHFVPFEKPTEVAKIFKEWLQKEMENWIQEEKREREAMCKIPIGSRAKMDDDWKWWVNESFGKRGNKKPVNSKL
ncbi:hypothetical protein HYALB_00005234 [Hymenoscyphus albidus]|uniref:Toxin biosynthesis protein n=1 Tax=Hymenoscyphus albidus TaxID=595503 RepID=A0A9N9LSU0_9HELO|nr:hypothetical protein HYALB_00005234 [Hymenoscyphus albidus]